MSADERDTAAHFIYRLFDAKGRLLYVGCTGNLTERIRQHKVLQPWALKIARHTSEGPYLRAEAYRRERIAIRTERPVYNLRGNPKPVARFSFNEPEIDRAAARVSLPASVIRRAIVNGEIPEHDLTDEVLTAWISSWPTERAS